MAPHSSTLAWKIPWTEEPGRLQSMGLLELDTTERLHFHCSLSCTGEGNGNPLQCSCLENPRDGEAWWAAISGVAQSRTRLKRLSSSSSSSKWDTIWRLLSTSPLILRRTLLESFYGYLCFTDAPNKAQRGSVSCSRSHSWPMVELGFGSSSRTCSLYFCFQLNAGVPPNHEILSLSL